MKKYNKIAITFILIMQGICYAGFAQSGLGTNPCNGGDPNPIEEPISIPDWNNWVEKDISSEAPKDPNEIIGLDGYDVAGSVDTFRWVSATQTLAYTVYFENDADFATAAASKVTINVPLHPKLNYATLGIGSFGFGSHIFAVEGSPASYQTRIDLRDSLGIFVDVVAGLDIVHNEAFWIFQSIDPATGLPPTDINMGFLPINDSLHSGEGFVTFTIKPQTNDCLTGDTVTATANIVFDVNESISTNTWLHTIDAFPPTSTLSMIQNSADQLTATFSGEDDEGGCGIKQFKLYCSQNEGAYQLYAIYQVGTTPQIPLETGIEYRFFVLAEDNVGNCEPMKSQPEFTIGTNFITLAVNSFPAEAGSTTGAGTYSVNETAELTATAAEGYHFVHWMQQGAVVSTQDPYSLSVTQNQTYTAYFERDAYTLQTVADTGSTIIVTDMNGNEVPSGSTILHADRLIVQTAHEQCYDIVGSLLNGSTFSSGDTLIVTGNLEIITQTTPLYTTSDVTVTACDSFAWHGTTYTQSGDYTFTTTNAANCDSIITLHLTINPTTYGQETVTACDSFSWHGSTYTSSGSYQSYLTNASGCDSVVTLHLTVNYSTHNVLDTTVCESFTWADGTGETYTVSDTYTHAYTNENGCTSVDTLHLMVNYSTHNVLDTTVCESFTWADGTGDTYTVSDTYTYAYTNANGCASVDTLHLTVNYGTHNVLDTTVCESFTWAEGTGETYTVSDTYTHAYTNANGCASVDTLHLTVNYGTHNVLDTTVCESFTWADGTGETYTVSDTYTHAYTNENGCASVDTLHLTVNYGTHNVLDTTVCESFTWADGTGETYTISDTYTHAYTNANGCASVDTLHLTVNYGTHNVLDTTVCESFTWADGTGETYTVSDTYTHAYTNENGCASVDTLHLTVNYGTHNVLDTMVCESFTWAEGTGETYTVSDTYTHAYTNENGCASVDTLHLTVNHGDYMEVLVDTCGTEYYWALADTTVSQSGTYYHYSTNANTCTDTTALMITLHQSVTTELSAQICEGETYNQNGFNVSEAGDYEQHLQTVFGCDSTVILHLTVDNETVTNIAASICEGEDYVDNGFEIIAPAVGISEYSDTIHRHGTCDSIVVLHLTVNTTTYGQETVTACDSFAWHGTTYTQSGDYTFTTTNAANCDSIVMLHLTINHGDYTEVTVDTCGTEFFWEVSGQSYDHSDTYYYYSTSANACQDTTVLILTLHQSAVTEIAARICEGDTYSQHGFNVSETGDYEQHLHTTFGCDSTVILHLTVDNETVTNIAASICEGEDYVDNGFEIIAPAVGISEYSDTIRRHGTCDSIVVLHLTVNTTTYGQETVTACDSFAWHSTTYTQSGDYSFTTTNAANCDSIVTLHLTINPTTYGQETVTACDSFAWHGTTYTQSGDYTFATTNAANCDSIVTLHLTVNPTTYGQETVTACDSFTWHGMTYTQSGDYMFTTTNAATCDSIVTLHLTINHGDYTEVTVDTCGTEFFWEVSGQSYDRSDTYYYYSTNANACQDTNVLVLTLHQVAVTELAAQICEGDTYSHNGFNVSEAGDYEQHLQTVFGCDSTVILHLAVDNEIVTNITVSICEGEDYVDNGFEIIAPAVGISEYSDTVHRQGTCDSIVVLHLTVNTTTYGDTTAVACGSFTWYGTTYTSSGSYQSYLTNANGCDSIVTLHLTINSTIYGDTTAIACNSFTWHGTTYTQSGDYSFITTNAANCDSIVTLHLTINHGDYALVTVDTCGTEFFWEVSGQTYNHSDIYYHYSGSVNACQDTVALILVLHQVVATEFTAEICEGETYNQNGFNVSEAGDYQLNLQTVYGCDSTVTLHLSINEMPTLSMIEGDPIICRNQFSVYSYDMTDPDYNYYWYLNSQLLGGNEPSVVMHETVSGTYTLLMLVEDIQNNCQASTSISVLVQDAYAPDTTVIVRKNNTNILICSPVSSEYGTVHYRWGYTNRFTNEETVLYWDHNYCLFDIGIDQQSYLYWVETYIQYEDGMGCANRSYYGYSVYTDIADYELNSIDARIVDNQLVLHVNAASTDMIDVMLYGINGQLLMTQHYGYINQVDDILPFHYSNGMYLLIIRIGNQTYPVKLLKL